MTPSKKEVIQTIEKTIDKYLNWKQNESGSNGWEIHTLLIETIWQCSRENSSFRRNAKYIIDRSLDQYNRFLPSHQLTDKDKLYEDIYDLYGVLLSLKTAYENDLLINIQQRIHADIFEDFIEIAENFLQESEKLKCPAAVMLGSVLESHMRKLCGNNGIEITFKKGEREKFKRASELNIDLAKKDIYSNSIKKQIEYWIEIRNAAAHGGEDKYSKNQVDDMLSGIRRFIIEYPV